MYYGLRAKINRRETPHDVRRSWMHFVCVFPCEWSAKKQNTPNWSFMADDANTQGGIGVLVSPFYICGVIRGFINILVCFPIFQVVEVHICCLFVCLSVYFFFQWSVLSLYWGPMHKMHKQNTIWYHLLALRFLKFLQYTLSLSSKFGN